MLQAKCAMKNSANWVQLKNYFEWTTIQKTRNNLKGKMFMWTNFFETAKCLDSRFIQNEGTNRQKMPKKALDGQKLQFFAY